MGGVPHEESRSNITETDKRSIVLVARSEYKFQELERMKETSELELRDDLESRLWDSFYLLVSKGRPGFNVLHTVATVEALKTIVPLYPELNEQMMIALGIAHDSGYEEGEWHYSYGDVLEIKEDHMRMGAENARRILVTEFSDVFSGTESAWISLLISRHDKVEELGLVIERVFAEADFLGTLIVMAADKATFTPVDEWHYLINNIVRRIPYFITPESIELAKELINIIDDRLQKEGMSSVASLIEAPPDILSHLSYLACRNG